MILCDTHADTLHRMACYADPGGECDVTLEKLRKGGVTVQTLALFVGGRPDLDSIAKDFLAMWRQADLLEAQGWKKLTDYRDCKENEVGFVLSVEGCDLLNGDLALLESWRSRGVRMAALTWNYENCVGTPAKISKDAPLKPFGREAVREMARLGIAPDVSHLNERGFYDLLEMGAVPLASHSCCAALCPHFRNLTDDQLKALFQAGGYVGVNFYPEFLDASGQADLNRVCDHVLHMLDMGGEGKIGFGSDFDGIDCKPEGLSGPQDMLRLLETLENRGVTGDLLRGIAGNNLLRYYDRIDPRPEGKP